MEHKIQKIGSGNRHNYVPDTRAAKIGTCTVLLSKKGELVSDFCGHEQIERTTDLDCPDYPSQLAAYSAYIVDRYLINMLKR